MSGHLHICDLVEVLILIPYLVRIAEHDAEHALGAGPSAMMCSPEVNTTLPRATTSSLRSASRITAKAC